MNKFYDSPRISSEYKDCSLPLTFDQSSLCAYDCAYCFAATQKSNNPSYKEGIPRLFVEVERLKEVIEGKRPKNMYYQRFFKYRFPFHWGGLTDPFDDRELKEGTSLEIIKFLASINYPTIFSTKGILMSKSPYYEIFKEAAPNKNFAFQFSIITNSDEAARKMELGCPNTTERLAAMKSMSDLGYWTILRLRPFIIDFSDKELEDLIRRAAEAGAKAISTEFFCVDARLNNVIQARYKIISDLVGYNIQDFYRELSPTERGTYLRLSKTIKAQYIERILRAAKKYGLKVAISDPDFKELNFSGSCCGLPSEPLGPNSQLHTWSRGQLTYFLAEMRKSYHTTGQNPQLHFHQIVNYSANGWLEDQNIQSGIIKGFDSDYGKDKIAFKDIFLQSWNNLRSPGNPFNYFHGKLKPVGKDKDNNLIFEYVPDEYEAYFVKEGLL